MTRTNAKESKAALFKRLRAAGLWPEAQARKNAKVEQLYLQGLSRPEAREVAWQVLAEEYPPGRLAAKLETLGAQVKREVNFLLGHPEAIEEMMEEEGDEPDVVETSPGRQKPPGKGALDLPDTWGVLPDSAAFDAEVEWVHQNMVLVIQDRGSKPPVFHWERAQKPAPSHGARNLMMFAATNRAGFMNILQRVKPGVGSDEDIVRREKVKIEEIRRILEEFKDIKASDK